MKLNRFASWLTALSLLSASYPAFAGSSTLGVTPGTGVNLRVGTDGSSNLFGNGAICDGAACAVLAAVKAASTAATTTDPALVVAISPNNTVAATQSGSWTFGLTQWAGGTLGAMANYGTSPGAVLVPGVNAYVTNTVSVSGAFWQATQPVSGTFWQTTQPVSAASLPLPTGAATAANQEVTTAGTSATSAQGVQGVTGGVALPVANAPSAASSLASSAATTSALGTSLVVKASAGNLYGFYCGAITGGANGYCIAYNAASAPSTGALAGASVLDICYFSGAAGCSLSRLPLPRQYGTGIVILVSSAATPFTYTTGTDTAFISADYQ